MNTPTFAAEASLYKTARYYRLPLGQAGGGRHPAVAQPSPAPAATLVASAVAGCCWITCQKNEEGHWECGCFEECWE
jgi:hypothetical protein